MSPRLAALLLALIALPAGPAPAQSSTPPAAPLESGPVFPADEEILREIPTHSNRELIQFYAIYHRVGNQRVARALLAEARKRDPKLAEKMQDAAKSGFPQAEELKISKLLQARKYREAADFLEGLRVSAYKGRDFPYERHLADCYNGLGDRAAERRGWLAVLSSKLSSKADQDEARRALDAMNKGEAIRAGYARLKERRFGEVIADADRALRACPGDQDWSKLRQEARLAQEIEAVEQLFRKQQRREALEAAQALLAKHPGEVEAKLLRARALVFAARFEEALPELESIKAANYPAGNFPGEFDLGEAYAAQGEFEKAVHSFQTVAASPALPDKDRAGAERTRQLLGRRLMSRLSTSLEGLDEGAGKEWNFRSEYAHFLTERRNAGVRYQGHEVSLVPGLLVQPGVETNWEADAFLHQRFGRRGFVEGWLGGGSAGKPAAGLSVGRDAYHSSQGSDQVRVVFNEPSIESLQLAALQAVQNAVMYSGTRRLTPRAVAMFSASGFKVAAGDQDIGQGVELTWNLKQALIEKADRYGLYLAYRGIHESFDGETLGDRALLDLGINPALTNNPGSIFYKRSYDPHGLEVSGWCGLGPDTLISGSLGRMYDFADGVYSFQAEVGVVWQATEVAELAAGAAYYSDGTGSANGGGALTLGTLSMQLFF